MSYLAVIQQLNDKYAPPDTPVLVVSVIGEVTCLSVSVYEEDGKSTTLTDKESLTIPTRELVRALTNGWYDSGDRQALVKSGTMDDPKDNVDWPGRAERDALLEVAGAARSWRVDKKVGEQVIRAALERLDKAQGRNAENPKTDV